MPEEIRCKNCKYDPINATEEMKNVVLESVKTPSCYHPNAYREGYEGMRNWDFWVLDMEECFEPKDGV